MKTLTPSQSLPRHRQDVPPEVKTLSGPIFNQDGTEFFFVNRPEDMSGALVDSYIDQLAHAGIGTFISCVNAQRTNYPSDVWQRDWDGYDPHGPDDQPALRSASGDTLSMTRQRFDSIIRLTEQGVDFNQRALERCRKHDIGAWIGVRMNDVHDCTYPESPLLSQFYNEHRDSGQLRAPHRHHEGWWSEFTLDWERPAVREHYMRLVSEQLERYDLDGIELDWMRFVYHFRPGRELVGGRVITDWIREVRQACDMAELRLGHPISIGVRVPADPQTARRCGLDGVAWAEEGLIDLLTPTPFWTTTDFDLPMETWRRMVTNPKVKIAGAIEVRYQPVPNGPVRRMTPSLTLGAAAGILHGGADFVYLFNYFPTPISLLEEWDWDDFYRVIYALRGGEELLRHPRTHAVTFRDIRAPGEPAAHLLPAWDSKENFQWPPGCVIRVRTGPRPRVSQAVKLILEFSQVPASPQSFSVYFNSHKLLPADIEGNVATYAVPEMIMEEEAQVLELVDVSTFRVVRVEIAIY